MYNQSEHIFASEEIEDGTVCQYSEQYCSKRATRFTRVKRGLHTRFVPLFESHDDAIRHAIEELPKLDQKHPEAPCVLVSNGRIYQWLVLQCPYCGRRHWHGGGLVDGDPRKQLGFRVPHCTAPFDAIADKWGDYRLVEKDAVREPIYEVVDGCCSNCGKTVFVPEAYECALPE